MSDYLDILIRAGYGNTPQDHIPVEVIAAAKAGSEIPRKPGVAEPRERAPSVKTLRETPNYVAFRKSLMPRAWQYGKPRKRRRFEHA